VIHPSNFFKSAFEALTCALLFLCILAADACTKDNTPESKATKFYFTGITPTDQNGNLMAAPDTSDWKTGDVWPEAAEKLFANTGAMTCTPYYKYNIAAFPNPCKNSFMTSFTKDSATLVSVRLVDENLKVLVSIDSVTARTIQINVSSFGIKDTMRLYYKFIKDNCEFRGHGDIVIQ
jgi:hypothetical protein